MYNFAIALYAFVAKIITPFHKKASKMVKGQKKTFAILREKRLPDKEYIWFHAASLGEFEQGRPMIEAIREKYPDYKILLTFFSPSGYEVRKNYSGADIVCYLPFDLPGNVNRFFEIVRPTVIFFIKYEFWMNYLTTAKKREVPTYIISAIFRPKQIFFRWYSKSYLKVLHSFNWLFVQDKQSQELLNAHAIFNVSISGDTRFDRVYNIYENRKNYPLIDTFIENAGLTLVAGSSWPKDEEIFISYFNQKPGMKLIIAPHEIDADHLNTIKSRLKRPAVLLSCAKEEDINLFDCLIIDCFGMLSSIYRYGNIAYIGGGFGAGIHNILEAAVYGIPVLFGPNYTRFKEAVDLTAKGGAFSFEEDESFFKLMNDFSDNPEMILLAGNKSKQYVLENIGTTNRILEKIGKLNGLFNLQVNPDVTNVFGE